MGTRVKGWLDRAGLVVLPQGRAALCSGPGGRESLSRLGERMFCSEWPVGCALISR